MFVTFWKTEPQLSLLTSFLALPLLPFHSVFRGHITHYTLDLKRPTKGGRAFRWLSIVGELGLLETCPWGRYWALLPLSLLSGCHESSDCCIPCSHLVIMLHHWSQSNGASWLGIELKTFSFHILSQVFCDLNEKLMNISSNKPLVPKSLPRISSLRKNMIHSFLYLTFFPPPETVSFF